MHDLSLGQRVVDRGHAFGDVAQRQERQGAVAPLQIQVLVHAGDLEHQVAVADHRALGRAGGARGIDQEGDVLGRRRVDGLLELRRALARQRLAMGEHAGEVGGHRVVQAAQALEVDDDDAPQGRAGVAHRDDLVVLLLILDEQYPHAGVVDDVLHLFGRRGRVDAGAQVSHALGAHVGIQPFGPVLGQHGDGIAAFQAQVGQRQADGAGPGIVVRPTARRPDALELVAQRRMRRPFAATGPEQLLRRVVAVGGQRL